MLLNMTVVGFGGNHLEFHTSPNTLDLNAK